jgi:hypothetical protein
MREIDFALAWQGRLAEWVSKQDVYLQRKQDKKSV